MKCAFMAPIGLEKERGLPERMSMIEGRKDSLYYLKSRVFLWNVLYGPLRV